MTPRTAQRAFGWATLVAPALVLFPSGRPTADAANALGRDRDPLVLAGAALPDLLGSIPSRIVAFRWEGEWQQIPVQVDERAVVDFGTIYNQAPSGFTVLTYADTSTFTGPDPDAVFDADDELVLMGKDAGAISAASEEPAGVLPGSGVELTVSNPLSGETAHAYLFESDGSLDPGAGASPIAYAFVLLSGDYKTTYDTNSGPNPENSSVTTASYSVHFADRWIRNETRVTSGGATGADILDRHKSLFAPGTCTRSENTFSNGEGAFIINKTGPVRALRGYVGANSGPTTHRIHAFYESREDVFTALRVHPIPGIVDFFDYSPAAAGMVFRNDRNLDGVTIDGQPDAVAAGPFLWEMVTGAQGTLVMTTLLRTDIAGFTYTNYYLDDATPPVAQCTGDAFAYGSSGFWRNGSIPNTDPALGAYNIFEANRIVAYDAPSQSTAFAEGRAAEAQNPLSATETPWSPATRIAGGEGASGDRSAGGASASGRGAFAFTLEPSPATGRVKIRLASSAPGEVTIRLYDTTGRVVAEPVAGFRLAGEHELFMDIAHLPGGIYFARSSFASAPGPTRRLVHVR